MHMILKQQHEFLNPNKMFVEMKVEAGTYPCEQISNPEGAGSDWYVLTVGENKLGAIIPYFRKLIAHGIAEIGEEKK